MNNIINFKIEDLIPYKRNPRRNENAINKVVESIREFGFKQPIVIDKNNVVVVGHTRLEASKRLGLKEVPVIVASDLSDEQIKAYRLVDNKTSEFAEWDFDLLQKEIESISEIDLSVYDFSEMIEDVEESISSLEAEAESENEESYYGDERERTFEAYNLYDYNENEVEGKYEMPIIYPTNHEQSEFIGFNYARTSEEYEKGIHFFLDDYQFERIWNNPQSNIEVLKEFDCCLTPDFSLYLDMPTAMKIWNTYRSRLIGQAMQREGIEVIPTVSWAEEDSFEYCFDGLPKNSVIAVSTIGVKRNEEQKQIWIKGMKEAIRRLTPSTILVYGGMVEFDFGDTRVIEIENNVAKNWAKGR